MVLSLPMKKGTSWVFIGIAAVAIGGLAWSAFSGGAAAMWRGTDVPCLPGGHANLALHIHPTLEIWVDGEQEPIPSNLGISATCMAEVHTHTEANVLHIETTRAGRINDLSLADFFAVWGQPFERAGYTAEIFVDGEEVASPTAVRFEDLSLIQVRYSGTNDGGMPEATIQTRIDQGASALDVKVIPLAVLEDSRCPSDVTCVQAGTVRVEVQIESGLGTAAETLALGEFITTEAEQITFASVTPSPVSTETIEASEYEFVFEISKLPQLQ